jgi:hypothetical protein
MSEEATSNVQEVNQEVNVSPDAHEDVGALSFDELENIAFSWLSKSFNYVEAEEKVKGPSTVNNALFVGSTADLAKMLKDGLKEDPK